MTAAPLVIVDRVSRRYGGEGGAQLVLDEVSFTLERGASMAIQGASGAGKSSLLHLIGALDRPSSGSIVLDGERLGELDDDGRARLRADKLGFVFQDHHLLPQCTALENVLVPTLARSRAASAEAISRAEALLERVGLAAHAHKRPHQLSGGERQRVAVVRALVNRPLLLLADEPTGALDHGAAENLVELLVELNRETGLALLVVTHAASVASRLAEVLELRDGRLARRGA